MDVQNYLVVKPDLLNAAAPQTDININTQLNESQSQLIEYDQTSNISLITIFDNERQTIVKERLMSAADGRYHCRINREKKKYIEAFFENLNWNKIENNFTNTVK